MTENKFYPYLGGVIEEVPAGEFQGIDQQTGVARTFTWSNHVKVTGRGMKAKLTGQAVRALVELYKKDADFRSWCDLCG